DKEATGYNIFINYSAEKTHPTVTLEDYKHDLVKNIFTSIFNQRLRELTQKENPPFVYASADFGSFARGYESFEASIGMGNKDTTSGLKAFEEELERVKKYGFTKDELERVKKNMLSGMERAYNEKNKTESANYAEEYIRNFLDHEPIPGIANEYNYYKELLPQITIADVNSIVKTLDKNPNQFIALLGPEAAAGNQLPTADDLLAVAASVDKINIKPYEEKAIASSLITNMPVAGKIISSKKDATLRTTDYTLSNGVTVTVKPTDFKNDEILMSAVRAGGKNSYGIKDKYNAEYATSIIRSMGIGDFSPIDLQKALSGKTVSVSPLLSGISDGFSGSSSVKDLETMMQLIYLYTTAPRVDTSLFHSFLQKNKAQLAFLSANPQVVFIDSVYNTLYQHNPLAPIAVPKVEYFDHIDLDRVMEIYKEMFSNANGMHFTFVGNFNSDSLQDFLKKYIAALPSNTRERTYTTDNKVRPVKGKANVDVYKGKEQKSLILEIYTGQVPYSDELNLKADAVSKILNIRIIEELREKIQGIYSGGTQAQLEKFPYPNYTFYLQLPCGPEKVDTLLYAANKEIQDLIQKGPSKANLEKVKQQWKEEYKTSVKENGTWLSELQSFYFPGTNPDYFTNYIKHVDALTQKDVQDAAKLLLSTKNVLIGVLRPQKK
ncbi:MAG: insulinase family protein, partial [Bacteroidota bacterium]|nr:insulinase family protein [Bacteroidota bacterium]